MYQKGRAWIELNRNSLFHNVREFQKLLPESCDLMPAIKADAYGHGAVLIAKALQDMGITDFCVATVGEGTALRRIGITGQILVLGYTHPYQFRELLKYDLTQTVLDFSYALALNAYGNSFTVHIGIDTGMHRLGVRSEDIDTILKIWKLPHLNITGVFSHLCVPEGLSAAEQAFTMNQVKRFDTVVHILYCHGLSGFKTHIQSSYGVLNYPNLQFDYARIGIALYGVLSTSQCSSASTINLRPVLSLKARIACVRELHQGEPLGYGLSYTAPSERKIAVISIGYADGIPRELSGRGHALIHGQKVPIIGCICMDQLFLDITDIPDVHSGNEVTFIGISGTQQISAYDFAEDADTIPNEILSRLGERLERCTST